MTISHDVVVIGGGPGGYVAAIRAAQLGFNTACVELEPKLGGTCLRVGCIPSKALLEASERYAEAKHGLGKLGIQFTGLSLDLPAMQSHKQSVVNTMASGIDFLFKKNKITRYLGRGTLLGQGKLAVDNGAERTDIEARHIIIATGSKVAPLRGVELGSRIGGSTEALSYDAVPQHLVVIGAGVIGLELGSVWLRLGAKVTVLEYLDRILPGMDAEIAKEAQRLFSKQGFEFRLGCRVTGARQEGEGCRVEIDQSEPLFCDRVLLCVGRLPNTEGLGLENVGIETDKRGTIAVDAHFRTKASGVYAVGDVIAGPMLAHKAEEEGIACVEGIASGHGHVNYNAVPSVVYTHPEIASVGKTEEELQQAQIPYNKGIFPFSANGRARALSATDGRVKILAAKDTDRVLGVHIIGPRAGDLIAEAAVAIEFGASAEDIARSCHAHPTLAEAVKEAALAVAQRAIHV